MAADAVVRIICPNLKCRAILSVPDSARGKSVRCRSCGTKVSVPASKSIRSNKPQTQEEPAETDGATASGA